MDKQIKAVPPYRIASVDNVLRVAAMLQLEGAVTVKEVAARLGVAGSTAHRLLAMLVYRDFAIQDDDRRYLVGPMLELGAHSPSFTVRLRAAGLPYLHELADELGESANLVVRTGDTVRFIASVESQQALRVGSREGMVFPAHRTTAGLLMLAELPPEQVDAMYSSARYEDHPERRPNLAELHQELALIRRRNGFAVNNGRSERGVVAIGVPVHGPRGTLAAGIAVSMPSVRYEKEQLPRIVKLLKSVAARLGADLSEMEVGVPDRAPAR